MNGFRAFSRKAGLMALAVLCAAAVAPNRADAVMVDMDLVFPSQANLSSFNRLYTGTGVDTIGIDVNATLWALDLVIPNIELSPGVSFAQLVVNGGNPVSATFNPVTGDVVTDTFDIVVTKKQIGNPNDIWEDTIEDFFLTTHSFGNICNGGVNEPFAGDPLDGNPPADAFLGMGDIKLTGAQCLNDFGLNGSVYDFNDVRFSMELFGNIEGIVVLPEPATSLLIGLVMGVLALPKRARKQ